MSTKAEKQKAEEEWRKHVTRTLADLDRNIDALERSIDRLAPPPRRNIRPFVLRKGSVLTARGLLELVLAWSTVITAGGIAVDHLVIRRRK